MLARQNNIPCLLPKGTIIRSDFSYSGTLGATVNTWNYTANLGFDPTHVIVNKIEYFNAGTDNTIYVLKSNLFGRDVKGFGTIFAEKNYNTFIGTLHDIRGVPVNSQTFTFEVRSASGTAQPSGGTITLELTFIHVPDS